jgi:uncharacterized protein (TIGR02246 family)
MSTPEQTVEDIAAQLEAAFNAKDASGLASLYAEDATLMPPNEAAVNGRPAIRAWLEAALPHVGTVRIAPARTSVFEREAFQVGTFSATVSDQSGPPNTFKYVLLLTRRASGWQIQFDIWNGDPPSR